MAGMRKLLSYPRIVALPSRGRASTMSCRQCESKSRAGSGGSTNLLLGLWCFQLVQKAIATGLQFNRLGGSGIQIKIPRLGLQISQTTMKNHESEDVLFATRLLSHVHCLAQVSQFAISNPHLVTSQTLLPTGAVRMVTWK